MDAGQTTGRKVVVGCGDSALGSLVRGVAAAAGLEATTTLPSAAMPSGAPRDILIVDEEFAAAPLARTWAGPTVVVAGRPSAVTWRVAGRLRAAVVALPDGEAVLLDLLLEGGTPSATTAAGLRVTLAGAVGGCGTSTLAVRVARALGGQGRTVTLVDMDRLGGGLELLIGAEREPGSRWPEVLERGAAALLDLPSAGNVRLLSFDRRQVTPPAEEVVAELLAALQSDGDVVVDAGRMNAATGGTDRVLVVAPLRVRAAAAATCRPVPAGAPVGVVVSGQPPQELTARDLADAVGHPVVLRVPWRGRVPRLDGRDRAVRRLIADWTGPGREPAA